MDITINDISESGDSVWEALVILEDTRDLATARAHLAAGLSAKDRAIFEEEAERTVAKFPAPPAAPRSTRTARGASRYLRSLGDAPDYSGLVIR